MNCPIAIQVERAFAHNAHCPFEADTYSDLDSDLDSDSDLFEDESDCLLSKEGGGDGDDDDTAPTEAESDGSSSFRSTTRRTRSKKPLLKNGHTPQPNDGMVFEDEFALSADTDDDDAADPFTNKSDRSSFVWTLSKKARNNKHAGNECVMQQNHAKPSILAAPKDEKLPFIQAKPANESTSHDDVECSCLPSIRLPVGPVKRRKLRNLASELRESRIKIRLRERRTKLDTDGIPDDVEDPTSWTKLSPDARITSLPNDIGILTSLRELNLEGSRISSLPTSIGKLKSLTTLNLRDSRITSLPPSIGKLKNLKHLNLSGTSKLVELPREIRNLTSLTQLDLSGSFVSSLPPAIGKLNNLTDLDLAETLKLGEIPDEIGNLTALTRLNLSWSGVLSSGTCSLPRSIGNLSNLEELDLAGYSNTGGLPEEIGNLSSLTTLSLCQSQLSSLPPCIGSLKNLRDLDLAETPNLVRLPEEIGNLTSLVRLKLNDSNIASLPASIGQLTNLEDLDLAGTSDFPDLPVECANLTGLKLLSVSFRANTVSSSCLPNFLARLPGLEMLALRCPGCGLEPHCEFLLQVAQACPSLGCIFLRDGQRDGRIFQWYHHNDQAFYASTRDPEEHFGRLSSFSISCF